MSANHLSPYFPIDEDDAQLFCNTLFPRPNILSELNNAAPTSPSYCTMVVDVPQRPLQAYLSNHPLPMSRKTASDLECGLLGSGLGFGAAESRSPPSDTSSSPSVVRISSHPILLRV